MKLTPPKSGEELLEMYYLELRSHLLEAAAIVDRLERAGVGDDPQLTRLLAATRTIHDGQPERAHRMQEHLSV